MRQLYADVGGENEEASLHLSFTGADNHLIGVGPTPIELLARERSAVFTRPQNFHNTLTLTALNGAITAGDALSFQGNLYLRNATRTVFNGNTTDIQVCDPSIPNTLCFRDPFTLLRDTSGAAVPNILGGATPGENDNSQITSVGLGGSLQATYAGAVLGRGNHLVLGASLDHADVDFNSTSEVGTIDPTTLLVSGTGIVIAQPDGSVTTVRLETTSRYYGLYLSDTLDVTERLAVTLGARYNLALLHLLDKFGTSLNGESRFSRLNPSLGASYKILPGFSAYAGYAEANRSPTAGEIACSNPARPCSLDNFLTSDPPGLNQVVAHTYEAGLRGRMKAGTGEDAGRIEWNLGFFRTDLEDDILNVPSAIISSGFFRNVGRTRRQGIEAGIGYSDERWQVALNYGLIDATFQSALALSSPNNPFADAPGNIHIRPGNALPGIPQHRLKLSVDYALSDKWKLGGNLTAASDQYFFGDQSNQNAKLGGYYALSLHAAYRVSENLELFALLENALDSSYATFGIFGDVTKTPLPGVPSPTDPRFISVAPPIGAFGGVRVRF